MAADDVVDLLVFITIGIVIFACFRWLSRRDNRNWKRAAIRLGVKPPAKFETGKQLIEGQQGNVRFKVRNHLPIARSSRRGVRGMGKSAHTSYEVSWPSAGPSFALTKHSRVDLTDTIPSTRGSTDAGSTLIDSHPFGPTVIMACPDEAAMARYLTPTRMATLVNLLDHHRVIDVTDWSIKVKTLLPERSADQIVAMVNHLMAAAVVLADQPVDE